MNPKAVIIHYDIQQNLNVPPPFNCGRLSLTYFEGWIEAVFHPHVFSSEQFSCTMSSSVNNNVFTFLKNQLDKSINFSV